MSEPVMMALGAKFGRQRAHEMVYEADAPSAMLRTLYNDVRTR